MRAQVIKNANEINTIIPSGWDIGFTGAQDGMSVPQKIITIRLLRSLRSPEMAQMFRHGDCIGADSEAHDFATMFDYRVIIHPPDNNSKRANRAAWSILVPKPYLVRNREIVDLANIMIATPKGPEEQRSGTWSTVRYARKTEKPRIIVMPDGVATLEM